MICSGDIPMNNDPTQPNTGVPTNPSLDSPRRVAVIGVHGVAHHDPGATANDMADLLLSLPSFDPKDAQRSCAERPERQFDHFETAGIQVPLQPVCVKDEEKVKPRYNQFVRWFQEGSARFARGISGLNLGEQRGKTGRRWSVKYFRTIMAALTAMLTFPAGSRAAAGQIPQKSTFMRCSGRTSPGLPVP